MARYIDAENKEAREEYNRCGYLPTLEEVIEYFPTEDVEPVRHGHWIITDYHDGMFITECSVCVKPFAYWKGNTQIGKMPYCPHCGAKMDEEKQK